MEEEQVDEGQIENYLEDLQGQLKEKDRKLSELQQHYSQTMFAQQQDTNLIAYQLGLDEILDRIEHLLKGDIVEEDGEGNIIYKPSKNEDLIVLNDYGVKLIMNLISFYLNRNTILSHHNSDRIYEILYDLGFELADLIYISYDKMGMNTKQKQARHIMLTMNILHTIESTYNRALYGGERDSLREARVVTQTDSMGNIMRAQTPQRKTGWSRLNPANWTP